MVDGQSYHFIGFFCSESHLELSHPWMQHYVGDDIASNGMGAMIQVQFEEEILLKNMIRDFVESITGGDSGHGTSMDTHLMP